MSAVSWTSILIRFLDGLTMCGIYCIVVVVVVLYACLLVTCHI